MRMRVGVSVEQEDEPQQPSAADSSIHERVGRNEANSLQKVSDAALVAWRLYLLLVPLL